MINEDWGKESMVLLIAFTATIVLNSIVIALEKSLFAVMGEKLTKTLRIALLEEIMHK